MIQCRLRLARQELGDSCGGKKQFRSSDRHYTEGGCNLRLMKSVMFWCAKLMVSFRNRPV
jgi:hypothetical protein